MSTMNPNDPFAETASDQPSGAAPAAKKTSSLVVCCGGIYFLLNFLTDSYQQQLAGNPVIEEHLGEIESMQMNLTKTAEAAENADGETFAFDVNGSVASGTVLIRQDPSGDGTGIASAELILQDGSRYPIPLEGGAPEVDTEFEIDMGELDSGEFGSAIEADTEEPGVPESQTGEPVTPQP